MWLAVHLKSLIINSTFMFPVVQPWPDLPISFLATVTVSQRLAPSSTRTVDVCPGIGILLHQGPVQMQDAWRLLMCHTTDSAYRKHNLSSYTKIRVWWSIALVSNSTTITQIHHHHIMWRLFRQTKNNTLYPVGPLGPRTKYFTSSPRLDRLTWVS